MDALRSQQWARTAGRLQDDFQSHCCDGSNCHQFHGGVRRLLILSYTNPEFPGCGPARRLRDLWELRGGILSEQDLVEIVREQVQRKEVAMVHSGRYLFCDTSPLTTAGYNLWMFGNIQPELKILSTRLYDGIILYEPDFPFIQDGTRRDDAFRMKQHEWYKARIEALQIPVLVVRGDVQARIVDVDVWLSEWAGRPQPNP